MTSLLAVGLLSCDANFAAEPAAPPRLDLYGDALPVGAIARLGTVRFRHWDALTGAAFSPDNRFLACSYARGAIIFWDAATGKSVREIAGGPTGPFSHLAFSPGGKLLRAGEADGRIAIWKTGDGTLVR